MELPDKQREENLKEQKSDEPIKKKYSKKELNEMRERISADIEAFRLYKSSGCYYDAETKNINKRLEKDDAQYLMWTQLDDSGWSDTKSPALFKNCRAIIGEYNDLDAIIRMRPKSKKDVVKKEIVEKFMADQAADPEMRTVDKRTLEEMIRYGWAIKHVFWNKMARKVKVPKKAREMDEEEREALKKEKVIPYTWKTYYDWNDLDVENINPEDFYPEAGAYRINSRHKPMNKCAVIDWITYDEFLRITDNDPVTIKSQAKKVQKGGQEGRENAFEERVPDGSGDMVERIRYYNKINDEFVTLYNNEICRISTLPFHKLPFVDYHFMDFKDHFFTPGLAALLSALMGDEEDIKNTFKDVLKIVINPPTYVDSMIFNEFLQIGDRVMPGEIIPITGLGSNDGLIREQEVKSIRASEIMTALGNIDTDQVEVSGINPRRFGSLQRSSNATEVATVDAASAKILRLMLDNFYTGEIYTAMLKFQWMAQEYSKGILFDKYGERLEKPQKRKLVLEGKELIYPKTDEEKLREKKIQGFSVFEIENDMFKFDQVPTFYIDPEVDAKLNKAATVQKWQGIFPQMVQFAGDSRYVPPGSPPPPFNINELAAHYLRGVDLPDKLLNVTEEDPIEDREEAIEENAQIMKGDIVVGQMGRSRYHIEAHLQAILLTEKYLGEMRNKIEGEINPMIQEMAMRLGIPPKQSAEEMALRDLEYRLEYLKWHTEIDRLTLGGILPPTPDTIKRGGVAPQPSIPQGVSMGSPAIPSMGPQQAGAMPGMPPVGNMIQAG